MVTVGLTGGISTGKSTVSRILREELHLPVLDADQVSRDTTAPGSVGLQRIEQAFGAEVIKADGSLNRQALGAIVMADPARRKELEAITHPLIREEITRRLQALEGAGAAVAVVEAALMVEAGSYELYDRLLVVSCQEETQLRRLMARNQLDEHEARRWIAAQMPLAEKEAYADQVIFNDGSEEDLVKATLAAWWALEF